jgi:molybdopterin-guanine dinucleotide biosynthesis protein A
MIGGEKGMRRPAAYTAAILCGGESRRAGCDKQLLPHEGTTLPKAIARKLEGLFQQIILVTRRPDLYADTGFLAVEDIVKGAGPLGGILTALRHSTSDYVYVAAGDMPYPNCAYIEWMRQLLERCSPDAVATLSGNGHLEPFNSFFSVRCAPLIEESLARGNGGIGSFLRGYDRALFVPEEAARRFSPDWRMFLNINTQADVVRHLASLTPLTGRPAADSILSC